MTDTPVPNKNKLPAKKRRQAAASADHTALRAWLKLLTCHKLMEANLRPKLREQFDSTLARFDLMAQLDRFPEGVKMRQLSRLLMVTGGNVTGLTDRLVEEGLIERHDDPTDRRAFYIRLTESGQSLFREMAVQHEQWIVSLLGDLGKADLLQLCDLLDKVKRQLARS